MDSELKVIGSNLNVIDNLVLFASFASFILLLFFCRKEQK